MSNEHRGQRSSEAKLWRVVLSEARRTIRGGYFSPLAWLSYAEDWTFSHKLPTIRASRFVAPGRLIRMVGALSIGCSGRSVPLIILP
jgi:hypothetical protein